MKGNIVAITFMYALLRVTAYSLHSPVFLCTVVARMTTCTVRR